MRLDEHAAPGRVAVGPAAGLDPCPRRLCDGEALEELDQHAVNLSRRVSVLRLASDRIPQAQREVEQPVVRRRGRHAVESVPRGLQPGVGVLEVAAGFLDELHRQVSLHVVALRHEAAVAAFVLLYGMGLPVAVGFGLVYEAGEPLPLPGVPVFDLRNPLLEVRQQVIEAVEDGRVHHLGVHWLRVAGPSDER